MNNPAFLLYTKDFLEGTSELTYEEIGVYIKLLCHQWERGSLPADEATLIRLLKLPLSDFKKVWVYLSEKFIEKDGKLYNARLENEREARVNYTKNQSLKGVIGAFLKEQKKTLTSKRYDILVKEVNKINLLRVDKATLQGLLKGLLKGSLSNKEDEDANVNKDINEDINKNKNSLKLKEKIFKKEINEFDYDEKLLEEFFLYWSEPNKSKTKMRFEQQNTWDTERRLKTWEKNNEKFNKKSYEKETMPECSNFD